MDHSHPAAAPAAVPVSHSAHIRLAHQDNSPAKNGYSPAAVAVPAAVEVAHTPAAHSDPTDSAAAAAAAAAVVAAVADPTADVADAAPGAGRRTAGAPVARRGYTGVGLGCRIDLTAIGDHIAVAGTIPDAEGVGRP